MSVLKPGMSLEEACEAIRAEAEKMLAGSGARLGLWTEVGRKSVLVGVALAGKASCVLSIDRAEYDGMKLLEAIERHYGEAA